MENEDRERLKRRLNRYHQHHDAAQSRYDNYSNVVNEDQRTLTQSLHRRWLESQAPKKLKLIVTNEELVVQVETKCSSLPTDCPVVVDVASDNSGSPVVKSANIPSSDAPVSPSHQPAESSSHTSRTSPNAECAKAVTSEESSCRVSSDLTSARLMAHDSQRPLRDPCDEAAATMKVDAALCPGEPCPDLPLPATPQAAVEVGTNVDNAPCPDLPAT